MKKTAAVRVGLYENYSRHLLSGQACVYLYSVAPGMLNSCISNERKKKDRDSYFIAVLHSGK